MSFRALSAAAHAGIGAGAPLSPVRQFAAETKQSLQKFRPERSSRRPSRATISSVGQRFVYNVVRRRLALQRQLEYSAARPRRRSRRAAVARLRKPRVAVGKRLYVVNMKAVQNFRVHLVNSTRLRRQRYPAKACPRPTTEGLRSFGWLRDMRVLRQSAVRTTVNHGGRGGGVWGVARACHPAHASATPSVQRRPPTRPHARRRKQRYIKSTRMHTPTSAA